MGIKVTFFHHHNSITNTMIYPLQSKALYIWFYLSTFKITSPTKILGKKVTFFYHHHNSIITHHQLLQLLTFFRCFHIGAFIPSHRIHILSHGIYYSIIWQIWYMMNVWSCCERASVRTKRLPFEICSNLGNPLWGRMTKKSSPGENGRNGKYPFWEDGRR